MTEVDLAVEETAEITKPSDVPVPAEPEIVQEPTSTLSEHEQAALKKGWKPRDQFTGNPDDYVEAKEFLKGSEFREHIHKLNRKVKEQQSAIDYMIEHNKRIQEIEYKRAMDDLLVRQRHATEMGDVNAVSQLTDQIVKMKTTNPVNNIPETATERAAKAYIERNKDWYSSNTSENVAIQVFSQAKADEIAAARPDLTPDEVFLMTEAAVKEKFALGTAPKKTATVLPQSQNSGRDTSFDRLPADIKKEIQLFQRNSKNFDVKKYISDCKKVGRL